ncbi:MAG: hypothetical protein RDU20_10690 [Desulfomonilaceae bacterium]|nr:hypothetical protein [Desulfomonilaceae bacterium]
MMTKKTCFGYWVGIFLLGWLVVFQSHTCEASDIRGPWVGSANGRIFGAKGSVNIVEQRGEDISGIVEGGNVFGTAKFGITGKVRGNHIFGMRDGHTFQGYLYPDGTIRGLFRSVDGDTYKVFLQRPYPYWGIPYQQW